MQGYLAEPRKLFTYIEVLFHCNNELDVVDRLSFYLIPISLTVSGVIVSSIIIIIIYQNPLQISGSL